VQKSQVGWVGERWFKPNYWAASRNTRTINL
jgi:hypothetical protein